MLTAALPLVLYVLLVSVGLLATMRTPSAAGVLYCAVG